MRIVVDTNVIVAGVVADGLCREIVETHLPAHTPVVSRLFWDELVEKLHSKSDLVNGSVLTLDNHHCSSPVLGCRLVNLRLAVLGKLTRAPKIKIFDGDAEADRLLARYRRRGHELPALN